MYLNRRLRARQRLSEGLIATYDVFEWHQLFTIVNMYY